MNHYLGLMFIDRWYISSKRYRFTGNQQVTLLNTTCLCIHPMYRWA